MTKFQLFQIPIFVFGFLFAGLNARAQTTDSANTPELWFTHPAANWNEALPVGNGRLGAMVFGGIESERLQLNEESLWAGKELNDNNPEAATHLSEIQQLLLQDSNGKAFRLSQ